MAALPSLDVLQRAAVAMIRYACGANGRGKDDPVYAEVTEKRDDTPAERARYSSCGDLYHWLMKRFDVEERWVNRTDDGVHGDWEMGKNVSDLAWCPLAFTPGRDWVPAPGDCVIVWDNAKGTDAHVMAWLGVNPTKPLEYLTGNYGAGGMSAAVWPGANVASKKLEWNGSRWRYGGRTVQRAVRFADAVKLSKGNIDLTGSPGTAEDLEPQVTGEDADAVAGTLGTPDDLH
jgi:hypothetical protein